VSSSPRCVSGRGPPIGLAQRTLVEGSDLASDAASPSRAASTNPAKTTQNVGTLARPKISSLLPGGWGHVRGRTGRTPLTVHLNKHAHALAAHVSAETAGQALHLHVRDDDTGGADPHRGSGLIGLKDRVEEAAPSPSTVPSAREPPCTPSSRSPTDARHGELT
jgi:hypothetical protein